MVKNIVEWTELQDSYSISEMDQAYGSYLFLDGANGPMVGNFFVEDHPRRLVVKVWTPAGVIEAKLLGCQLILLVSWPAQKMGQKLPPMTTDELALSVVNVYLPNLDDGQLISLRNTCTAIQSALEEGLSDEDQRPLFNDLFKIVNKQVSVPVGPAAVYQRCAELVTIEIERRMGTAGGIQRFGVQIERDAGDQPGISQFEIDEMVKHIMYFSVEELDSTSLPGLVNAYKLMADTRRSGEEIQHLGGAYRLYPAEVFEQCQLIIEQEINRRTPQKGGAL